MDAIRVPEDEASGIGMILLSEICPPRVPEAERGPGHRAREAPRGRKGKKGEGRIKGVVYEAWLRDEGARGR